LTAADRIRWIGAIPAPDGRGIKRVVKLKMGSLQITQGAFVVARLFRRKYSPVESYEQVLNREIRA
jgi:hypothetical protein